MVIGNAFMIVYDEKGQKRERIFFSFLNAKRRE